MESCLPEHLRLISSVLSDSVKDRIDSYTTFGFCRSIGRDDIENEEICLALLHMLEYEASLPNPVSSWCLSNCVQELLEMQHRFTKFQERKLKLLLQFGADPNCTNASLHRMKHMPLLHLAAMNFNHVACRMLLEHGAEVNMMDDSYSITIIRAINNVDKKIDAVGFNAVSETFRVLVEFGAKLDVRDPISHLLPAEMLVYHNEKFFAPLFALLEAGAPLFSINLGRGRIISESKWSLVEHCLDCVKAARHERFLAFAMGLHARLGEDSPVNALDNDVLSIIAKHIVNA